MSRKGPAADQWVTCPACGKRAYSTKRSARATRRNVDHASTMNIYACPEAPQYYHVGHIPDAVRAGTVTRAQWLTNAAARDARMRGEAS